jgi:hypothetical protein
VEKQISPLRSAPVEMTVILHIDFWIGRQNTGYETTNAKCRVWRMIFLEV